MIAAFKSNYYILKNIQNSPELYPQSIFQTKIKRFNKETYEYNSLLRKFIKLFYFNY